MLFCFQYHFRNSKAYFSNNTVAFVFVSSDTLWELAAAEVQSREGGGGEEDGGETVNERSVFLMGSKAGVCLPSSLQTVNVMLSTGSTVVL